MWRPRVDPKGTVLGGALPNRYRVLNDTIWCAHKPAQGSAPHTLLNAISAEGDLSRGRCPQTRCNASQGLPQ
eukprot:12406891-Karenia_brevis.AAC.1